MIAALEFLPAERTAIIVPLANPFGMLEHGALPANWKERLRHRQADAD